jgi:PAS domain S-box-containing protein
MSIDGATYAGGLLPGGAEEAIRQERDLLSAVLDTAGALVVVLDPHGQIVLLNQACERAIGYSFDEVRGKRLWDGLLIAEEVEPVRTVFEQLRAGQFPNEFENIWLTKTGERRLIAWSNTAILGADGAVEYVIGIGIDITERRQTEAQRDTALHLQQRLASEGLVARTSTEFVNLGPAEIDTVFESAPLGMAIAVGRKPMYINPAWQRMLGYTEQEFLSMSLFDYAETEDAALDWELYHQLLSGQRDSYQIEKRYICKGGRGMWGRLTVSAARVSDSEPPFTIAMIEDITEQKQSQQALQEAYDTLERRVEERTGELVALNAIAAVVSPSLGLNQRMSTALDKTLEVMGLKMGVAYRLEGEPGDPPSGQVLRLMAQRGVTEELARLIDALPLHGTFVERAACTGGGPTNVISP